MPQWNCACRNCAAARAGRLPQLTQATIAISADEDRWFLLNASPDLRVQIESFAPIRPRSTPVRNSPIEAVLLTNGDLDHVLGLLLLREGDAFHVHATAAVRSTLTRQLHIERLLGTFGGMVWHDPPTARTALSLRSGKPSGLRYRMIALPGGAPRFAGRVQKAGEVHNAAYEIIDERHGATLLVAPNVAAMTPELEEALRNAQAILFDGTFWSNDELRAIDPKAASATEMGHLPVRDSLAALRQLPATRKIYVHINNTNPMLADDSSERLEVERAGCAVGFDGLEFEL